MTGIAAKTLSDDDLRRELAQLKTKQHEIEADGTPGQRANHQERTAELEAEFLARFGSHGSKKIEHVAADEPQHDPQPGIHPGAGEGPPAG